MIIQQASFLYVEDDPASRQVMKLILEKAMGVQSLVMFEDSTDFIPQVKALPRKPDLILLDIQIKPHDGFEMLHMLRADPEFQDAKVVALTASVMNEEVERLRSNGFDGAIGKPLSVTIFPGLINRILDGEGVWYIV